MWALFHVGSIDWAFVRDQAVSIALGILIASVILHVARKVWALIMK